MPPQVKGDNHQRLLSCHQGLPHHVPQKLPAVARPHLRGVPRRIWMHPCAPHRDPAMHTGGSGLLVNSICADMFEGPKVCSSPSSSWGALPMPASRSEAKR